MQLKRITEYRRFGMAALTAGLVAVAACDDDPLDPDSPSNFGEVAVSVTTTGYEPDFPEGYQVSLEGGGPVAIDVTGETVLYGAPSGSNTVVLTGLPANCTAAGNPATANVSVGEQASVAFDVTCAAVTGGITPAFTVTGAAEDIDTEVTVDVLNVETAETESFAVDPSAPEELLNLAPGSYTITLAEAGISANCTVAEPVEASVDVTAGQSVPAAFTIDCVPNVGDLTVNVNTTGTNPDDGYTLTVGTRDPVNIGANGANEFNTVRAGNVTVVLGGIAPNCSANGGPAGEDVDERTTVEFGGAMATIDFTVTCE